MRLICKPLPKITCGLVTCGDADNRGPGQGSCKPQMLTFANKSPLPRGRRAGASAPFLTCRELRPEYGVFPPHADLKRGGIRSGNGSAGSVEYHRESSGVVRGETRRPPQAREAAPR